MRLPWAALLAIAPRAAKKIKIYLSNTVERDESLVHFVRASVVLGNREVRGVVQMFGRPLRLRRVRLRLSRLRRRWHWAGCVRQTRWVRHAYIGRKMPHSSIASECVTRPRNEHRQIARHISTKFKKPLQNNWLLFPCTRAGNGASTPSSNGLRLVNRLQHNNVHLPPGVWAEYPGVWGVYTGVCAEYTGVCAGVSGWAPGWPGVRPPGVWPGVCAPGLCPMYADPGVCAWPGVWAWAGVATDLSDLTEPAKKYLQFSTQYRGQNFRNRYFCCKRPSLHWRHKQTYLKLKRNWSFVWTLPLATTGYIFCVCILQGDLHWHKTTYQAGWDCICCPLCKQRCQSLDSDPSSRHPCK